jgi:hypothetical protein
VTFKEAVVQFLLLAVPIVLLSLINKFDAKESA